VEYEGGDECGKENVNTNEKKPQKDVKKIKQVLQILIV
jgi:hypothetical protein